MTLDELAALERDLMHRNLIRHGVHYPEDVGAISPSGAAVAGHDGHLFIADGLNKLERQLMGDAGLLAGHTEQWTKLLAARIDQAEATNVRLVHLIVPEKQLALPRFRWPDGAPEAIEQRPAMKILAAAPPQLHIVYPLARMMQVQASSELYWRGDSHWCASGCALAAEASATALLDDEVLAIESLRFERGPMRHDLLAHFSNAAPMHEVIHIAPSGNKIFDNHVFRDQGLHRGNQFIIRNETAPIRDILVIFGDSYAFNAGLAYALSAVFREVDFVFIKDVLWDYVRKKRPRYVLWECAERFLATLPAA